MIHETSKPSSELQREENQQTRIPGTDGQSRALASTDRFDRAVLPRRQEGASTFFVGDHAAHALFEVVVHLVGPPAADSNSVANLGPVAWIQNCDSTFFRPACPMR